MSFVEDKPLPTSTDSKIKGENNYTGNITVKAETTTKQTADVILSNRNHTDNNMTIQTVMDKNRTTGNKSSVNAETRSSKIRAVADPVFKGTISSIIPKEIDVKESGFVQSTRHLHSLNDSKSDVPKDSGHNVRKSEFITMGDKTQRTLKHLQQKRIQERAINRNSTFNSEKTVVIVKTPQSQLNDSLNDQTGNSSKLSRTISALPYAKKDVKLSDSASVSTPQATTIDSNSINVVHSTTVITPELTTKRNARAETKSSSKGKVDIFKCRYTKF